MTTQETKEMANRIKKRREQLAFTQEQFAETIGISTSSYTKIENAFQKPALDTLISISKQLGLSLDYLVWGSNEPPRTTVDEALKSIVDCADKDKLVHTRDVLSKLIQLKK